MVARTTEPYRLPKAITQIIGRMTEGDPTLQRAVRASSESLLSDEVRDIFAELDATQRTEFLFVWREAVVQLVKGTKCDCCASAGRRLRFMAVGPDADFQNVTPPEGMNQLTGWMILCADCDRRSPIVLRRKLLDRYATL